MVRSKAYIWGMVVGMAVCILLFGVIAYIVRKRTGVNKREYDERQKLAQGTAYKYAFFTAIGYACAVGVFDQMTGIRWCDTMTCAFLGICVSTLVFATICIWQDAYMSFREPPRNTYLIMGLIMLANLGSASMYLHASDSMVENGMLTYRCVNLVIAVMLAVIIAMMALKRALDRRKERDGQV
ncbi:MAG: hypothetical protein Q4E65_02130 [Clostridia bacterium]|nr:hypothetical protein [Clostridia bacterium]